MHYVWQGVVAILPQIRVVKIAANSRHVCQGSYTHFAHGEYRTKHWMSEKKILNNNFLCKIILSGMNLQKVLSSTSFNTAYKKKIYHSALCLQYFMCKYLNSYI